MSSELQIEDSSDSDVQTCYVDAKTKKKAIRCRRAIEDTAKKEIQLGSVFVSTTIGKGGFLLWHEDSHIYFSTARHTIFTRERCVQQGATPERAGVINLTKVGSEKKRYSFNHTGVWSKKS